MQSRGSRCSETKGDIIFEPHLTVIEVDRTSPTKREARRCVRQARKRQDVEDEEEKERFRVATLLQIRQKSVDMTPELWLATQEARYALCVC